MTPDLYGYRRPESSFYYMVLADTVWNVLGIQVHCISHSIECGILYTWCQIVILYLSRKDRQIAQKHCFFRKQDPKLKFNLENIFDFKFL